jgi:hypothetical protein
MTKIIDGSTGLEFPDGSDQTSAFTGNAAAITSGTLAIANGGTNATTASSALSNLGGVTTGKAIAMAIVFGG